MVEDYHNRKMAKKKRKREGQDERPEGKRVRAKKNKTRRICRGLCYQDPFEVRRKGQTLADVQQAAALGAAEDSAAPPKAKRRRKHKPDSSLKQSTSINLLASSQTERIKPTGNPCIGTPDVLLAYPQPIQQYMLNQGLTGPTPVQERYKSSTQPPPPAMLLTPYISEKSPSLQVLASVLGRQGCPGSCRTRQRQNTSIPVARHTCDV